MDRKFWTLLASCCLVVALFFSGVSKSIALFFFMGIVPGTSIVLSPITMMCILIAISWVIIMHITGKLSETIVFTKQAKEYLARKERLPRRRYAFSHISRSAK
ncbi:MAG TPA: hypothetical protein PKE10_01640 [Candidatus Saccharibacteria bacterium]|nr:hypothetical protein [Candidatus Saccharibacteria bacterium]